jgi:hypothetical protein
MRGSQGARRPLSCPRISEVTASGSTPAGSQSSQTRSTSAGSSQVRKEKPQVQDERPVSIDMGGFKGPKHNYNDIRDGLPARLRAKRVIEKLTIKYYRPGPGDRIDVVFADKDEANKAKQHSLADVNSLVQAVGTRSSTSNLLQAALDVQPRSGRPKRAIPSDELSHTVRRGVQERH